MATYQLQIQGMSCASCVVRVEGALSGVKGVRSANVNLATEKAHIEASGIEAAQLVAAVRAAGYEATAIQENAPPVENGDKSAREGRRVLIAILLALPLLSPMAGTPFGQHWMLPGWWQFALATPLQFWLGARFYRAGWKALRAGSGNMDLLVALGTSAAYGLSLYLLIVHGDAAAHRLYFESAAVVIALVLLGKWLEARAKYQTTAAIRALHALRPAQARLRKGDREMQVPIQAVQVGDIVVVHTGEAIPVDGLIMEGNSHVNEALLTGESMPLSKGPGERVIAGSLNGEGVLAISTSAIGGETVLAQIVRLVEDAQAKKAPIQKLVDRVAAVFVPIVLFLALSTFAGWGFIAHDWEQALLHAVAVLVIACPCALGLATPAAIMAGTGVAARQGILIQDAEALEKAHRINTVAFDKTGTLTRGEPQLIALHAAQGIEENDALRMAAGLQQASEHPLGKAVVLAAQARHLNLPRAQAVSVEAGRGLSGTLHDQDRNLELMLGNQAWMNESALLLPQELLAKADAFRTQGYTVSWLAQRHPQSRILALIVFGDEIKEHAAATIHALQSRGIRTLMISGDNAVNARVIAAKLGIDEVLADVLPADKVNAIRALQAQDRFVAMVGDGVNDAAALAAADVGIAMGSGADVAMHAAGMTLMRGDPRLVLDAIDISTSTYNKIRQNLFWAFIYNIVGIPLAAFGLLSPMIAGGAMAFSSLSVVANALLLRRWRAQAQGEKQ